MEPIIRVQHLSKHFKQFKAVDDLSFTVNQGDIYGFLGQNGAGKSTTMRMLLTLIFPTNGNIEIFGKSLTNHRKEILQQVGALIEKPDLYKYLSAYENLKLFAALSNAKLSQKELLHQLQVVGLEQRANDKVKTFSQGMKQRLGIAIALVNNPSLVILDEPTNGLDPQGIADIRVLIKKLSVEHKKTVVISSHLLSEIEQTATKILIIDKGKKVIEGLADELFNPAQTVVKIETNDDIKALQLIATTQWQQYIQRNDENIVKLLLHKNQIPQLQKSLAQMDVEVFAIQPMHSLEDYFLKVTNHVHTI